MSIKKLLIPALFILTPWISAESSQDLSTITASGLVREYIMSDDKSSKTLAMKQLNQLHKDNPENINLLRMYSGILASSGEYRKAIKIISIYNLGHSEPSFLLSECLLKDRTGDYDPECYNKVITLKTSLNAKDIDYLMALFMTHHQNFKKEKSIYMQGRDDNQDLDIFDLSKQDVLKILYPDKQVNKP